MLKKRILPLLAFCVLLALVFSVAYVNFYHSKTIALVERKAVFENSSFDYILMNPSNDQVHEIKDNQEVIKASPVYLFDNLVFGKNKKTSALFFESREDMNISMFNPLQQIAYLGYEVSNPVYLTYRFAKENNYQVGDTFTMLFGQSNQAFSFVVEAIYLDAYLFGDQYNAVFLFDESYRALFTSVDLYYNLLFVDSNSNFDTFVQSFIPMAKAPYRGNYSSDELYEKALLAYRSNDYSYAKINASLELERLNGSFDSRLTSYQFNRLVLYLAFMSVLFVEVVIRNLINKKNNQVITNLRYKNKKLLLFELMVSLLMYGLIVGISYYSFMLQSRNLNSYTSIKHVIFFLSPIFYFLPVYLGITYIFSNVFNARGRLR